MRVQMLAGRLVQLVPVIVASCLLSFGLTYMTGDPVALMVPADATVKQMEELRHAMGFDRPIPEQLASYLGGIVTGDWGTSIRYQQPVLPLIAERIPATLALSAASLVLAILIGVPAGVIAASRRLTPADYSVLGLSVLGQAVPTFWLGLILMMIFSVNLRLLPASGFSGFNSLILPSLTLAGFMIATIARVVRAEMSSALSQDFVRTARAKGLSEQVVLYRHVFRNAAIPVITVVGLLLGQLLAGAVVTEVIFAWPGMGSLLLHAIYQRDFPLVRGTVLVIALVFAVVNLIVDVVYTLVDPRTR